MTTAIDLSAVKARQQVTWASGDYGAVAARIHPMSELLVTAADLPAGARVLDVATGTGNAAIAAARCGCLVTGIDYVPELLERGHARAAAERLPVTFVTGDAERLAYPDGSFDAVLSGRRGDVRAGPGAGGGGAGPGLPARRHRRAGVWTPEGFIGELFRTVGRHVPPPAGLRAAGPVGRRGPGPRAVRRFAWASCGRYAGTSSSASPPRRSSPTSSGPTTGRR